MKQIALLVAMAVLFTGNLIASGFSLDEAVAFLKENGYEFTIAYDEAVKELPEGAVVFTPFWVESAKDEADKMLANDDMMIESTITQENYVWGDVYFPQYCRAAITGGYEISPIGNYTSYKFKWELNTTSNQQSPGWVGITRSDVCSITNSRYGATQGNLQNCSCSLNGSYYECTTSSFGKTLLNYYSAAALCKRCLHITTPYVVSILFSVNPQILTWVYNPILKIWIPIYVYLGWSGVLSDGDGPDFDPVWDLCSTDLSSFCTDQEIRNFCGW